MPPVIVHRLPPAEEYNALRRSVEWPVFDSETVDRALANTLFSAVAIGEAGQVIGMGRVLGDNAIYFHIQDVIVRSDCKGQGIGNLLMQALLDYVASRSSLNTNIGLMCSKDREPFYRNFGFIDRPNEKFGSGMIKIVSKD